MIVCGTNAGCDDEDDDDEHTDDGRGDDERDDDRETILLQLGMALWELGGSSVKEKETKNSLLKFTFLVASIESGVDLFHSSFH